MLANGASVVLTVALARLLSPHSYGVLNQLTGLYLILSMPGSAVVVAVVRRVTMWHEDGSGHLVRRWAGRVHRQGTMLVLLWAVLVFVSRHGVAVLLNQQSGIGIAAILTAAAFFVLLSLDRGLLQAHRSYRPARRQPHGGGERAGGRRARAGRWPASARRAPRWAS